MSENERNILFADLCARLPYDVKVYTKRDYDIDHPFYTEYNTVDFVAWILELNTDEKTLHLVLCDENDDKDEYFQEWFDAEWVDVREVKPYLRPMASMTESELKELDEIENCKVLPSVKLTMQIDFMNSIHIDYRGLIDTGFALPAPKGMYE